MTLTVGHIAYANCVPFFHYLRASGFTGPIVAGVPAELNRRLATGSIDLAPSSAFEYARNWQDYLLLPNLSISARGPVRSVLLFSAQPPEHLAAAPIIVTRESASSVNLLTVLLREYYGASATALEVETEPAEQVAANGGSVLLIGDRALRAAATLSGETGIYDLGELWQRATGLPFVFALWIVRQRVAEADPDALRLFCTQLESSRARFFADPAAVAAVTPERDWLGSAALIDYWRCMSYDLADDQRAGLRLYFALCHRYGLLDSEPPLRFFV